MKKFWLVACLFAGLVAFAQDEKKTESGAGESVLLRYKFTKGDVRTFKSTQEMKTEMMGQSGTNESEIVTTETIDNIDGGVAAITNEVKSIKMSMDMGGNTTSFDSTKKDDMENAKDSPMFAPMRKMLGKSVSYKMNEKGEVTDIDLKAGGDDKAAKSMAEAIKNKHFSFPEKAVAVGDKWSGSMESGMQMGKLKMAYTCKFMGFRDLDGEKCARIRMKFDKIEMVMEEGSPIQMQIENAEGNVIFYLSLDKGIMKKSKTKMGYDMKMGGGEKGSMTMHFDMNSDTDYVK